MMTAIGTVAFIDNFNDNGIIMTYPDALHAVFPLAEGLCLAFLPVSRSARFSADAVDANRVVPCSMNDAPGQDVLYQHISCSENPSRNSTCFSENNTEK